MQKINPQYIIDKKGNRISVVIPVNEELEDIRLYDKAKSDNGSSLPIDKAFEMIEAKRKSKK